MANEKLIDTTGLKYYHDNIALNTFVDKTSAQTINGAKTFTSPIYLTNSNFHIEKNSSSNVIDFTVNGTKVLTLGASSSVVNSVLRANADNSKDLGTSTVRWKDVYVAGNLSDGTNSVSVANIANKNVDNQFSSVQSFTSGLYVGDNSTKRFLLSQGSSNNQLWSNQPFFIYSKGGSSRYFSINSSTGAPSTYSLAFPDTSSYTADKTIATLDDIPSAITSINGLSGGELTSPITLNGGDSATAHKIILGTTGQITDTGTATLFGRTNATTLIVGHSSHALTLRGSATRPTYNGNNLALKSDVPSLDDVHLTQNNTVIVGDALTNISGKSLSAYTSQETTVGGYPVIKILKNSSILSESDASSYMAAQTGSSYVPEYNYDNPSYSYLIFSNGTIYKPQWDSTNGLLLYKMNQLAFKSDVPTISISKVETTLNVNTAKTITLNGTLWKLPSGESSSSSNVVKYYGINSTSTPIYVEGAHYYLLVPMGTTSGTIGGTTTVTTFYGTAILYVPLSWGTQNVNYTLIYRSSATAGITSTTVAGRYVSGSGIRIYGACKLLDLGEMVGGLAL